jgi:hypothetical protein
MLNLPSHSYEELRSLTIDALLKRQAGLFNDLVEDIGKVLLAKHGAWPLPPGLTGIGYPGVPALLHPYDTPLISEVFWDLFRQGAVTLGRDAQHTGWPGYHLSRFGKNIAQQSPFRFHDTNEYIAMVQTQVPDISAEAVAYLEEAIAAFYADCLLASSVMLGVAAEAEFLRLIDVAGKSAAYARAFASALKPPFIGQKITKFLAALRPLVPSLPHEATEDLDTNFLMIQSVLRIARNEAGHPTAAVPKREQVYINLQLFAPFARQLMRLRKVLT